MDRDEEQRLLVTVADGRAAAAELARATDPARRADLQTAVDAARRARAQVLEAHQGFVATVARRYSASGVPLADLIQDGNIGLLAALDRFDPSVGVRFNTFAFYWVRQTILAGLPRQIGGMCTSRGVAREVYRLRKIRAELEATLRREATTEEVADAAKVTARRVGQLEMLTLRPEPLNDEIACVVVDLVDDGDPANLAAEDSSELRRLVDRLPENQRFVISSRYGLGSSPRLQSEVAEALGVTVSRVSQIERAALEHLRRIAGNLRTAA